MSDNPKLQNLRIATVITLSPKKMGSGEVKLLAVAKEAQRRGHHWTLFSYEPVHPDFAAGLEHVGAKWKSLNELGESFFRARATFAREFDVIELNLIPPRGKIALASYAAFSCNVHMIDRVSGPPPGWDSPSLFLSRLLDRFTLIRVRQLAGVSRYVRERDVKRYGLSEKKATVIYNGVDPDRFSPPVTKRANVETVKILGVGTLIPEKGFDVLLKALAKVPHHLWELRIVGEGKELSNLMTLADELGISANTEFLGLRDDVADLSREADIFVHPSVWHEAFGHTVVEGMSCECCVFAARVGGIPELLEHEKEGFLLEAGNVDEWSMTLERVIKDYELRQRLGSAARKRVLKDFTLEQCVTRELDFLEGKLC